MQFFHSINHSSYENKNLLSGNWEEIGWVWPREWNIIGFFVDFNINFVYLNGRNNKHAKSTLNVFTEYQEERQYKGTKYSLSVHMLHDNILYVKFLVKFDEEIEDKSERKMTFYFCFVFLSLLIFEGTFLFPIWYNYMLSTL